MADKAAEKKPGVDESKSKRAPVPSGKTVKVRAIQRGQYGRPVADIHDPDSPTAVFSMFVADLESVDKATTKAKAMKTDAGREARMDAIESRSTIDVDGVSYLLPSWVEDARKPAAVISTDDAPEPLSSKNDDVI